MNFVKHNEIAGFSIGPGHAYQGEKDYFLPLSLLRNLLLLVQSINADWIIKTVEEGETYLP